MPSYQIDENKNLVEPSGKVVKKVFNFTIGTEEQDDGDLPLTFDPSPSIASDLDSGKLLMVTVHITSILGVVSSSFVDIGTSGNTGSFSYVTFFISVSPVIIVFEDANARLSVDPTVENRESFITSVKGQSGYLEVYTLE